MLIGRFVWRDFAVPSADTTSRATLASVLLLAVSAPPSLFDAPVPALPVPAAPALPVPALPVPAAPVPAAPVPAAPVPALPVPAAPLPALPVEGRSSPPAQPIRPLVASRIIMPSPKEVLMARNYGRSPPARIAGEGAPLHSCAR